MIYPPLDELLKHAENRFMLTTLAAKRARQIIEKDRPNDGQSKAVTIALEEIASEQTKYDRTKTKAGIK